MKKIFYILSLCLFFSSVQAKEQCETEYLKCYEKADSMDLGSCESDNALCEKNVNNCKGACTGDIKTCETDCEKNFNCETNFKKCKKDLIALAKEQCKEAKEKCENPAEASPKTPNTGSGFSWNFTGWNDNYGKVDNEWPHMDKTLEFQKAYNTELEKLHAEGKCLEKEKLEKDGKYGPLTHEAREFVSSNKLPDGCIPVEEEKTIVETPITLPPVTNGNILPGPEFGSEGKSYIMHKFLPGVTNKILVTLIAVSVIMGIISGLFYLTSSGNSEMTKKGRDILVWTIVGLAIAILSYTIVKFIININFFS